MATLTPNKVAPDAPDPKSNTVKWLWIAGAILALLIVIPVALILMGRGTDDGTTTTTQAAPTTVATTLAGGTPTTPTTPTTDTTPTTAGPTTPTTTPVTTIPTTTIPDPEVLNYDIDVDALVANPLEGTLIVSAAYGDGADQVGFNSKGDGPCCFDVFSRDGVVLLDSQNLRLMRFEFGEQPSILAEFDGSDIIPDALAVFGDSVVVVGMTNRATDPYDVMVLSLETGEVLGRGPVPTIDVNGDLRSTPDGVFWAAASSHPQWTALVDDEGRVLDPEAQTTSNTLPGPTTLEVFYDAGIEVQVQPPGDAPLTTYDVIAETAFFSEVFKYGGYTDGALVMIGDEFDAGVAPLTLVEMGTSNDGSLVTTAHALEVERWSTTGSFGTFRYAYGGFWVLNTTPDGIEIVRYDLN